MGTSRRGAAFALGCGGTTFLFFLECFDFCGGLRFFRAEDAELLDDEEELLDDEDELLFDDDC